MFNCLSLCLCPCLRFCFSIVARAHECATAVASQNISLLNAELWSMVKQWCPKLWTSGRCPDVGFLTHARVAVFLKIWNCTKCNAGISIWEGACTYSDNYINQYHKNKCACLSVFVIPCWSVPAFDKTQMVTTKRHGCDLRRLLVYSWGRDHPKYVATIEPSMFFAVST